MWNDPRPMAISPSCAECRAISRELSEIYDKVRERLDKMDPATLETRLSEFSSLFADGEYKGQTLPTIAPEILDPSLLGRGANAPLHKPDYPFVQVIRRKLEHEAKTGHKITFP